MALNENQQIIELVDKAKQILITGKQEFDGDSVASAAGLYLLLEKLNKRSEIVFQGTAVPQIYDFLPARAAIKNQLGELQKLIIKVDTREAPPGELSYDRTPDNLHIYLTPKSGILKPEHITMENSDYKFDLIITLGAPDLESLGQIYEKHPDFFYNIPIINIDHLPNNEHYGQINIIKLTAAALGEIIFELGRQWGEELLDQDIATCLYTGIAVKTRSFKNPNLTPKTLHIASQLLTHGAEREKIIHKLYQTKSVNTLKLWGRALARLQFDEKTRLAWSQLSEQDFILTNTTEDSLTGIIEELIVEAPQAELALLLYEYKSISKALLYTNPHYHALHLTKKYEPTGHKQLAKIKFPGKSLIELEHELIQEIQNQIKK